VSAATVGRGGGEQQPTASTHEERSMYIGIGTAIIIVIILLLLL
jgi:hypothetical protein